MQAPDFWWTPPDRASLAARLLGPFSLLWGLGARIRAASARPVDCGIPVICVGNLTAGGAGKTPTVVAIVERLMARGVEPHVLLRGYGGRLRGPHRVRLDEDTVGEVGDEALIHAARAPTWIARDRADGARAIAASGAQVIVMDDGFQNPSLRKTLSIVVIDAEQGFGNGRLIPAGPLREPIAAGLARADACLLIGRSQERAACRDRLGLPPDLPIFEAELAPVPTGLPLANEAVVAFAGIGRPAKFFQTLSDLGARIVASEAFPDHHVYDGRLIRRLIQLARGQDAMLVTTEKDAVRLSPALRREVMVVNVALAPIDPDRFDRFLADALAAPAP